jgi:hypothetical protein
MPSRENPEGSGKRMRDLERRVRDLEDRVEIQELKAHYCYYIDNHEWESLARMFARRGLIDCGDFGRARGRKAIRKFFAEQISGTFAFFLHMVHNPIIEIDGNNARGTWYWTEPSTYRVDGLARLIQGRYDEEYVKENGEWRFKSVILNVKLNSAFEFSWERRKK